MVISRITENGSHLMLHYQGGSVTRAIKNNIGIWVPTISGVGIPDIAVTNITANAATVTLTAGEGKPPTQWQIQVSVSPSFSGALQSSNSSHTFTLSSDTNYYARGRAGDGTAWSDWTDTVSFKTDAIVTAGFRWPFNPDWITTEWEGYEGHKGVDWGFAGVGGQPIHAAQGGTVERSGWYPGDLWGWGNVVEINHGAIGEGGATLRTVYAHMNDTPLPNVNDTVSKWQVLGYVGTTGNSTGDHLHWETSVNGTWNQINPRTFMALYGE